MDFATVREAAVTPLARDATQRSVLMWLAIRANNRNEIIVRQSEIAEGVLASLRGVRDALRALRAAGPVRREPRHGAYGQRAADYYLITLVEQSPQPARGAGRCQPDTQSSRP